jgi:hypothetical protein
MALRTVRMSAALGATIIGALGAGASPAEATTSTAAMRWSTIAKTLQAAFDPASTNPCNSGRLSCVFSVIGEMENRFSPLASSCSHDAVFSLAYLRTTQQYNQAVANDPSFFQNNSFINHEDGYFASFYFQAYDNWYGGRPAAVPPAWRIAFQAADARTVNGSGDLLLGMNAHVNRDLPFVLDAIGLTEPGGYSLYQDHERVNDILLQVVAPLLTEEARRFDPAIGTTELQGTTLDDTAFFQLLRAWREQAWDNAERLANAATPAEWQSVAQTIEDQAAAEAQSIVLSNAYAPPLTSTTSRDAYCAAHWAS